MLLEENLLKKERKKRGLSQRKVADQVGIATTTYTNIENGKRNPRLATAKKISDFFGISINDVID